MNAALEVKDTGASNDGYLSIILKFLRVYSRLRIPFLVSLLMLMLASSTGLAYLCWYLWLPILWEWGFSIFSWRTFFAALVIFYAVLGPVLPLLLLGVFGQVINLYVIEQEEQGLRALERIGDDQKEIEKKLEEQDKSGLVSLIRYSRLQLEAYYRIGLDQTKRSFRYSVISMWLGFCIIMIGISTFFLPTSLRQYFEGADIKSIPIIGGVVIELISALFLWVYKSSITQLTYFYNRQLDNHNVLICSRIASAMKSPDRARATIISKFMDYGQRSQLDQPALRLTSTRRGKKAAPANR